MANARRFRMKITAILCLMFFTFTIISSFGGMMVSAESGTEPTNVALKKPVTSSDGDNISAEHPPSKAVDGSSSHMSGWDSTSSQTMKAWLQIDLEDEYVITRVEYVDREHFDELFYRANFEILASNDPTFETYTKLGAVGAEGFDNDTTWGADVTDLNAYRYVRFQKTAQQYVYLVELRVFGTPPPEVFSIERTVAEGSDDAEEFATGGDAGRTMTTSSDLEMIHDAGSGYSEDQIVGIRFTDIDIRKGATITNAYVQFTSKTSTGPANLTINAQYIDDAPTFTESTIGNTSTYNDIASREITTAQVDWTPPEWNVSDEAGEDQRTPNLKSIIQEVINRAGWINGNAIALIITGESGHCRNAYAYEAGVSKAPKLYIEYILTGPVDTTAPEWLAGSKLNASNVAGRSVTLTWDAASDDTAVTKYRIYKDSELLDTVAGDIHSYNVTGLDKETEYAFKVEAGDAAGNWSTDGPTVTVTTIFAVDVITEECFASYETDLDNNQLTIRMKGLSGSFTVDNSGGNATTYTVTVKNVDPDYVTISQGTITSRGTNSFVFSLNIPANNSITVDIEPWYLPDPDNFYFIAWSDNQDGTSYFKNKLLPKAVLINPILSVCAGDVLTGTPPTIGGAGTANEYSYPNDGVKEKDYLNYLSLIQNHTTPIFEVPGNHDLARGGWVDGDDSRYDVGQAIWRKYLGPINYSFDVGNTHFIMTNFHYDMPTWTKRWGGNINGGYLRLGTRGYGVTLPNDDDGDALYNWLDSDLAAAAEKTNRISVSHHNFNMFIGDGGTVSTARNLYSNRDVNYMISGHSHNYQTGTDSVTGIPYLVTGDAQKSNPGFSLVHVNGSNITEQHMYADNLNLNVKYNNPNDGSVSQGSATVSCSGYNLPFVRLKFKMSNNYETYEAEDVETGESIPAYSKRFSDYTVVYVETSINDGATKNIKVNSVGEGLDITPPEWPDGSGITLSNLSQTGVTLTWPSATDNTEITGYKIYKDSELLDIVAGDVYSYDVTGLTAGTDYTFTVQAVDAMGNESTDGPTVTVTTAPKGGIEITVTASINNVTKLVTISGSISSGQGKEVTVIVINPSKSTDYIDQTTSGEGGYYKFSYLLDEIVGGTYKVTVGGTGISSPVETTFAYEPSTGEDITAPTWPEGSKLEAMNIGHTGLKLIWTAAEDDTAVTGYKIYKGSELLDTVAGDVNSYDVTGLTAGTSYTFKIEAVDAMGNESTDGPTVTVTTVAEGEVTVTVNVSIDSITKLVTISGNISSGQGKEVTVKVISPMGAVDYLNQITSGENGYYEFSYPLSQVGGVYRVAVSGTGISNPVETIFTYEPSTEDTTAPTWPEGSKLEATNIGQTGLKLTWTAAEDDTAVIGYKVYKGSELLDTVAADLYSYAVTGLSAGSKYIFKVEAVDAASNESIDGPTVTVTTASKPIDGGGGYIPPIQTPDKSGTIEIGDDGKILATPVLNKDNQAVITFKIEDISKAAEKVQVGADGTKVISIKVEKVNGAREYVQGIPVPALTRDLADMRFRIETEFGTMEVPSNMLKADDGEGSETSYLSIKMVEKSNLGDGLKAQIGERPVVELKLKLDNTETAWNNSNTSVTVSIPYKPTAEELEDPEHITVWHIDDSGVAVPVTTGRYDAATDEVKFTTTYFGEFAVVYVKKTFDDITNYSWAKKSIEVMASKGVISGTSSTTYNPGAAIKRCDFILLLVKALGLTAEANDNFADVRTDAYYADALAIAKKLGIAAGVGDNRFQPDEQISRQDMMALIDRAMKVAGKGLAEGANADLARFADKDSIASYAMESVAALVKEGIVVGDGTNINPLGNATRAETAVLIYKIYSK